MNKEVFAGSDQNPDESTSYSYNVLKKDRTALFYPVFRGMLYIEPKCLLNDSIYLA